MLNKILPFITLITIAFGERLVIVRDHASYVPPEPPGANLTLVLESETGTQTMPAQKYLPVNFFKDFDRPEKRQEDTLNILVLRVEFVEDQDSLTSGNGKMDLVGFNEPDSGLRYDPPHRKIFFERQMQFLSNFYKTNSFGHLVVNYTVKPDGDEQSYQLPQEMGYYSGFIRYDADAQLVLFNTYAMEMGLVRILADAVAAADFDSTVDFSAYDEIIIFHAGTLWQTSFSFFRFRDIPSATIPSGALEYYLGVPYILANAGTDTVYGAGINAEMARVDEYMVSNLGTVCHEFGHTIGLPDLYDVSGWSNGVGAWDLMGTGGYVGSAALGVPEGSIPANFGAWPRYFMGWVDPVVVSEPETLVTVRASEIDTTQYGITQPTLIKIPLSQNEFYLIENRQQDIAQKDTIIVDLEDGVPIYVDYGEYDFFLPGSGMLVWHIDDNIIEANYSSNTIQINPQHKGIDLEEADGIQHFDAWYYGSFDPYEYFGSPYDPFFVDDSNKANHHFGPFTNPNSDTYYGKSLLDVEIMSTLDTLMGFSVKFDIYQAGFPVLVEQNHPISSVSYGDLNNDGTKEIIVAMDRGNVRAYNVDGSLYGSYTSFKRITTFLAVGDINGDGADDIIFGNNREIQCLDGFTLAPLPHFPVTAENEIPGAPLIFDLDGDAQNEIIFGSKDRKLYCIDSSGTNIANFPLYLYTELLSTPCVFKEEERHIGVLGSNGMLWLIDQNGIIKEFTDSKHNMLTYASPVVGDLDRDGNPEVVTVNGYGTIYIYGDDTLEYWFDILIDTTYYMTPGLADIDDDGYLEIIMSNSSKTIYVCNRNGTSENNFPLYLDSYSYYPLLAADLDSAGGEEIIFGLGTEDSLGSGYLKIITNRNKDFPYSPLFGEGGFTSPGVVFDLDEDGDMELACGSGLGMLYVWDFPGSVSSWTGYMNSPKNWGMFLGTLRQPQASEYLLGTCYVYPSPVETNGRVRFFLHQDATVTVEIMDIVGHEIGSVRLADPTPQEYNEVTFDFTRQSNGVYIARVEADNGTKREVKFYKFAILK